MTYILAEQLKDAGFPQDGKKGKKMAVCLRKGCETLVDNLSIGGCPVCFNCDEYWYKMGSRRHVEQCECRNKLGECREAKMEYKADCFSWAYFPTFSELIEACGSNKIIIWRSEQYWHAGIFTYGSDHYVDDYPHPNEEGETPEEAVAHLW